MRVPHLLIAIAFGLLPVGEAGAQEREAILILRMVEWESGEPVDGAHVRLSEGLQRVSDRNGAARISGIPAGTYLVEVRRIGYATERVRLRLGPGEVVERELRLVADPVPLDPVAIQAPAVAGFDDRRRSYAGTFLTREEIVARAGSFPNPNAVLRTIPSLQLAPDPEGDGHAVTSRRRGCYSHVFLNGILVTGERAITAPPGRRPYRTHVSGVDVDRLTSLREIEAIEWYPAGLSLPVEFHRRGGVGGGARCGTLVIWTRRP